MKKIIPDKLFNLKSFEKVCPAKNLVPLADMDIELFINRHNAIIHIEDEPYPFDVDFTDALEYCGRDNLCRLYKIHFGSAKNEMVFVVNADNLIERIMTTADLGNPKSIETFAAAITVILRNVGLNVQELQEVNEMIQHEVNEVFHWCAETERFVLVDAGTEDNICYMGFFAAVE